MTRVRNWLMARGKSKDLTQRTQRKAEDTEKAGEILHPRSRVQDDDVCGTVRGAENAEKTNGKNARPAKWDGRYKFNGSAADSLASWGAASSAPTEFDRACSRQAAGSRRDAGATISRGRRRLVRRLVWVGSSGRRRGRLGHSGRWRLGMRPGWRKRFLRLPGRIFWLLPPG